MFFRIQNLYLILAFLAMIFVLSFPIAGYHWEQDIKQQHFQFDSVMDSYGVYFSKGGDQDLHTASFPFYIVFIILGGITGLSLLSFKDRKRQLKIGRVNFLLHLLMVLGLVAGIFIGSGWCGDWISAHFDFEQYGRAFDENALTTQYGIGFFAAIVTAPLLFMANRGMMRDEKLVRSLDRLR